MEIFLYKMMVTVHKFSLEIFWRWKFV